MSNNIGKSFFAVESGDVFRFLTIPEIRLVLWISEFESYREICQLDKRGRVVCYRYFRSVVEISSEVRVL